MVRLGAFSVCRWTDASWWRDGCTLVQGDKNLVNADLRNEEQSRIWIVRGMADGKTVYPTLRLKILVLSMKTLWLYVVAAGGRFVSAPYPAARESNGICM